VIDLLGQRRDQVDELDSARERHHVRVDHLGSGGRSRADREMLFGAPERIESDFLRQNHFIDELAIAVRVGVSRLGFPFAEEDEPHALCLLCTLMLIRTNFIVSYRVLSTAFWCWLLRTHLRA
jgi:hypothetical protein